MKKHDVNIDKNDRVLLFKFEKCQHKCFSNKRFQKIFNKTSSQKRRKFKFFKKKSFRQTKTKNDCEKILIEIFHIMIMKNDHEIIVM